MHFLPYSERSRQQVTNHMFLANSGKTGLVIFGYGSFGILMFKHKCGDHKKHDIFVIEQIQQITKHIHYIDKVWCNGIKGKFLKIEAMYKIDFENGIGIIQHLI